MYNRYIPEDASYSRIGETPPPAPEPERAFRGGFRELLSKKEGLSALLNGGEGGGLSGMLKTLRLDGFDRGDILLLLILLYLFAEGDDLDLVIALGVTLLLGLGEE